jgi:hypothetical protein
MSTALDGRRDGTTFDPDRDAIRLAQQATDVWAFMRDGGWHMLRSISHATGHPEASVSARLRDYRKSRFGSHTVERMWNGRVRVHLYRLVPNREGQPLAKHHD